jgi:phosphate transport system ATP-binding protein
MDIQPIIQTQKLTLAYGSKLVLQDVTFSLPQGGITAIVGPSGCGKSSFLNCLNRLTDLIPSAQVSGKISIGTLNILDRRVNTIVLSRRIGTIFQKPNPFPLSIWRNFALPLKERGIKKRSHIDEIIRKSLENVGLWTEVKDRLQDNALNLSGGQQQRLCIARALALQPEVILMDEPCSALDPISSKIIEDLIVKLKQHYTIAIVTHNLAQAKRIADYVALFWVEAGGGRLIEFNSKTQFFTAPNHELTAAYIKDE